MRILETFAGPEGPAYLVNAVTEVAVEDNAFVDHYKLQLEGEQGFHVATLTARLGRDARFADHSFSFGAAISRSDIDVRFEAEGGECVLNGLFMVDGTRLTDTHSRVDHAHPHCASRELYKGVLDGSARGVFNGLVQVRPGAHYRRSLGILEYAARQRVPVKSGLMLGLGESPMEIAQTLTDLKRTGCRYLTLGQYLAPSRQHHPVIRFVPPEEFDEWTACALRMGFKGVTAGPLVRSSYRAEEMMVN